MKLNKTEEMMLKHADVSTPEVARELVSLILRSYRARHPSAITFVVKDWGERKIQCIKVTREHTGMSLADAKRFVEDEVDIAQARDREKYSSICRQANKKALEAKGVIF